MGNWSRQNRDTSRDVNKAALRVTLKHRACTLKITLGAALAFIKGEIFCGIMTVLSIFLTRNEILISFKECNMTS